MLTPQCLRPEWGEGAIGQDGQVTILDLPKSTWHTIYRSYSLQPCTLLENTVSKLPCGTADGNFQSYLLSKGKGKGILFLWPGVLLNPDLRSNP